MPRKPKFTNEQILFILKNSTQGGNWLSQQLNVDRAAIYQWATDNKISVKKGGKTAHKNDKRIKKMKVGCSSWPKKHISYKRFLVLRDGLRCHYCDISMTYNDDQIDHVLAKARGGSDAPTNLVLACARCNHKKSTLCYRCPEFRDAIA